MSTRKARKSERAPAAGAIDQITAAVLANLQAQGWTPPDVARPAPMTTLVLRVPEALITALDKRGPNRSDVARGILAEGLGLKLDPPQTPKSPRRR